MSDYETKVTFGKPLEVKGKLFNEVILITSEPFRDVKQPVLIRPFHMTFLKMRKKRKHWYSLCKTINEIPVFSASY